MEPLTTAFAAPLRPVRPTTTTSTGRGQLPQRNASRTMRFTRLRSIARGSALRAMARPSRAGTESAVSGHESRAATAKRASALRAEPWKTRRNCPPRTNRLERGKRMSGLSLFKCPPRVRDRRSETSQLLRGSGVPGPLRGALSRPYGRCGSRCEPGSRGCARASGGWG